ncbi:hydrogenase nickel incorporation protein HypB [Methylomarinovum tepidoasis]|uniref:hydrogenase nickel incorporation protein HypB n=1 Tax=Methylomarinovum tepidoasis TaxID=2840183 RepID=UPI002574244F|nr:hydrogenase nickel incorporation protein HypB [Methylomarinovum sp. IN45]
MRVEKDLLAKNDRHAAANRKWLADREVTMVNLMASPGAGKTSLLVQTLEDLQAEMPFAVIEGDQQTSLDAHRIRACGVPAVQINTGRGCHLDAHQVGHALADLDPAPGSVVWVENVGNLVCPAGFDLGEHARVVLLSVTEGDDKPLKYPHMFHSADLVVLTKTDLLPYVDFDVDRCIDHARRLRPGVPVLQVSVKSGEGMAQWYGWLRAQRPVPAAEVG